MTFSQGNGYQLTFLKCGDNKVIGTFAKMLRDIDVTFSQGLSVFLQSVNISSLVSEKKNIGKKKRT